MKETALFGVNIHAVVHDAKESVPAIRKMFDDALVRGYTVKKIMPSLEDVFVSSIETYDEEHKEK